MDFSALSDREILEKVIYEKARNDELSSLIHNIESTVGFSLSNIIDLEYERLIFAYNTDSSLALHLKYLQEFAKRYLLSSYISSIDMVLDTSDKLIGYFTRLFLGATNEEIRAIGLDNDLKLICEKPLATGNINCVQIPLRKICEFVILHNLTRIVIAHNHPQSKSYPSADDFDNTDDIVKFLTRIDVEVIDHIIVGLDNAFSLRSSLYFSGIWI